MIEIGSYMGESSSLFASSGMFKEIHCIEPFHQYEDFNDDFGYTWDDKKKESLRIDLWTKDMPLDEMKLFFFQIFSGMAQTYRRATQDEKMTQTILDFTDYFAEKNDIFKK